MKTKWINTNKRYHDIIAAPDMATRHRLYREGFIEPWQAMMQMVAPMSQSDSEDALAGARAWAWAWVLPEDLTDVPETLQKLEDANSWQVGADALVAGVARFDAYADRIPMEEVEGWLIVADPERSNPIGRGYTGAIDFTQPRLIVQFDTINDYTLPRLSGAIVHELHHLIRLRLFPWDMANTNVADYIIHEGMAESFAAALFGEEIVGYYVTDISDDGLQTAKEMIGNGLEKTGFNVIRAYIFGDYLAQKFGMEPVGMPDYGGYAIGYRVVQAYLQRTGKTIEEATFCPATEIIAESAYFD